MRSVKYNYLIIIKSLLYFLVLINNLELTFVRIVFPDNYEEVDEMVRAVIPLKLLKVW